MDKRFSFRSFGKLLGSSCGWVMAGLILTMPSSAMAAGTGNYRLVGYIPDWKGDVTKMPYNKLTHVNYAFLMAKSDGSLDTSGVTISRLQQVVTLAHAQGTKVLISLGGGGNNSALTTAMRNATARGNLETNALNFVSQYGLDGLDFDWEGIANATDGTYYGNFVNTVYNTLHPLGKLTTTAVASYFGKYIPTTTWGALDFVNVMAYDDSAAQHSSYSFATTQYNYFLGQGVPVSKCVLGVPFYGYATSDSSHSNEVAYNTIVANDSNAPNSDYSNYLGGVYYNGIPTIQNKTNFVLGQKGGGMMIWELAEDTTTSTSLTSAIYTILSSGGSGGDSNIASSGTGYVWAKNTSSTSNSNRTATAGVNDGNLTTNVPCVSSGEVSNGWEGAGVVFSAAKTVSKVDVINGDQDSGGNGWLEASISLQFSTDGTTWSGSGWGVSPTYSYTSAACGQTYTFTGTAKSGVKGARIVGQVRVADNSWKWIVKEVRVYGH